MKPIKPRLPRNITITVSVVLLHLLALWALQSGLLRRSVEQITPAEMLVEISLAATPEVEPPTPQVRPAPATKPMAPVRPTPSTQATPEVPAPAPVPPRVPDTPPAPLPLAPSAAANSSAPALNTAAPSAASTSAAPIQAPAAAKVELPSSNADYLNNPKPPYPPLSKRLGEQGQVIVHVLIGADGVAQKAEVQRSSGFDRLDQTAVTTALQWRYVPGKRAGVAETMWFSVPFNFVLK